jgi:hypothetical protein
MRPLCKCGQRPRAINYKKEGKTFYRSLCDICSREGLFSRSSSMATSRIQNKTQCEKCGHRSPHPEVFRVFHLDGNLDNCRPSNLKTVCCNCAQILAKRESRGNKVILLLITELFDKTFHVHIKLANQSVIVNHSIKICSYPGSF